ncbi:MAG: 3-isopropylmalate dehydratase small subunit [Thermoguttaceae bacterium]
MQPFTTHAGTVVPIDRSDIDTDQLMPKQFLKRVERSGFGKYLFYDWRYLPDGTEDPDFILNRPEYRSATVLLSRRNFGCGSSREHAPWGLADYGFRVVLASSFADIFYNNCFKNGILPVVLTESEIEKLFKLAAAAPLTATVNLTTCEVTVNCETMKFTIDPHRRNNLLQGLDDIGETLTHEGDISHYESVFGIK